MSIIGGALGSLITGGGVTGAATQAAKDGSAAVLNADNLRNIANDTANKLRANKDLREQNDVQTALVAHQAWKGIFVDNTNKARELMTRVQF